MITAHIILHEKFEENKPLGRPKRSWEEVIKMDLKNIGPEDVNWIHLAQNKI
jgi:hypothetical protein